MAVGTIEIQQISTEVAKFLRLVNDKSIKFARKAAKHMNESGRYVPIKLQLNMDDRHRILEVQGQ